MVSGHVQRNSGVKANNIFKGVRNGKDPNNWFDSVDHHYWFICISGCISTMDSEKAEQGEFFRRQKCIEDRPYLAFV